VIKYFSALNDGASNGPHVGENRRSFDEEIT